MIKIQIGKWFSLRIGRLPRKAAAVDLPATQHALRLVDDYLAEAEKHYQR